MTELTQPTQNRRKIKGSAADPAAESNPDPIPKMVPASPEMHGPKRVVNVLVDGAGRLGPLSYVVPVDMKIQPGIAVKVPFGHRTAYGFVLGDGDPNKATREILERYGKRVSAPELEMIRNVASRHLCEVATIAARLAPRSGKSAQALDAGPVKLAPKVTKPRGMSEVPATQRRRLLVCAPLVDQTAVAAREAARMSQDGQVLVLCPTIERVAQTMSHFTSGAARLDAQAAQGAWKGFAEGSVTVGIGTRAAALYSADSLAGIVVLEEEHPGHREMHQPHTHARDLAAERSRRFGAQLTLVGSNPTALALGARLKVYPIGGAADWPRTQLVDLNEVPPEDRALAPALVEAAQRGLAQGSHPVVLSDGKSSRWLCVRCGSEREGPSSRRRNVIELKEPCTRCQTQRARLVGWDAARIKARFPSGVRAVTFRDIHSIASCGLVIIPDIDTRLKAPGFDPDAAVVQLFCAAARAAGRNGTLVAASSNAQMSVFDDLFRRRDLVSVAKRTWQTAKDNNLPPFERQVFISVGGDAKPRTAGWPGVVLGPRHTGRDWEILVRIPDDQLSALAVCVQRLRRRGKVRVTVT